jgi:2-keto-3-deoxy-6-phosphogluconate aldolase
MKRPLIAILRGVKPDEVEDIVSVLIESGMTAIEIPLSSPDPFRSIKIAAKRAPAGILVGAGTVLTLEAVERLHDAGGRLLITPPTSIPKSLPEPGHAAWSRCPTSLPRWRRASDEGPGA